MRFDIGLVAALLPSACLAAKAYGPASVPKDQKQEAVSLATTDGQPPANNGPPPENNGQPASNDWPTTPTGRKNDKAGRKGGKNDCGSSTFNEITTATPGDAPLVVDCQALQADVIRGEHEWVVPVDGREVVRLKSCGFFASAPGGTPGVIGNGDVSDLILDVVAKYGHHKYVSAKGGYKMFTTSGGGGMACDNPAHIKGIAVDVDWNISKVNKIDDSKKKPPKDQSKDSNQGNNGG